MNEQAEAGYKHGFVAMWMPNDDRARARMEQFYEVAIRPAVEASGFKAYRVDRDAGVNRIDVETMVAIDEAAFVIADLTAAKASEPRANVYFEAGYAYGKKPVIWTCREDQAKGIPFDIRQMQQVRWDADKLAEAKDKLGRKIVAELNKRVRSRKDNEVARLLKEKVKELKNMTEIRERGAGGETTFHVPADFIRFTVFKDLVSDVKLRAQYKPKILSDEERYEVLEFVRQWEKFIAMITSVPTISRINSTG